MSTTAQTPVVTTGRRKTIGRRSGPRNPAVTTLKTFGRSIRDEPHYLVYSLRFWAKRDKLDATALADWCSVRYDQCKAKTGARYRINTYGHKDGKRYVDCVFFERLTESDKMELELRFGSFVDKKQHRSGKLRRPKLSKAEKKQFDAMRDQFYADVAARRAAAAKEALNA